MDIVIYITLVVTQLATAGMAGWTLRDSKYEGLTWFLVSLTIGITRTHIVGG